jgi:hypothetical protein
MHNNLCILALNSKKLRVKEILLQHMCQKSFPLNTSKIRESFFILKFTQHLYLNGILNDHVGMFRYSKTRELEEMGNRKRDKKIKNAQKNVH